MGGCAERMLQLIIHVSQLPPSSQRPAVKRIAVSETYPGATRQVEVCSMGDVSLHQVIRVAGLL